MILKLYFCRQDRQVNRTIFVTRISATYIVLLHGGFANDFSLFIYGEKSQFWHKPINFSDLFRLHFFDVAKVSNRQLEQA